MVFDPDEVAVYGAVRLSGNDPTSNEHRTIQIALNNAMRVASGRRRSERTPILELYRSMSMNPTPKFPWSYWLHGRFQLFFLWRFAHVKKQLNKLDVDAITMYEDQGTKAKGQHGDKAGWFIFYSKLLWYKRPQLSAAVQKPFRGVVSVFEKLWPLTRSPKVNYQLTIYIYNWHSFSVFS